MTITTYNYSTGTGFVYNASLIGFTGGFASLLLGNNPGAFSQNYASSTGFTFNSANTEFVGGVMRQKNQAPATLAAYAAWDTFLNVNYGSSTLAVTAFNSAAVSSGFLNLQGSTTKYVQLPSAYVVGNQATIAFQYQPNYTGHPGANQIMYGNSGSANYFALYHAQSTGNFTLSISDQNGVSLGTINFGVWNPTSGTNYTIVCQVDITNGATKLFINGAQFGTTSTVTGVRTSSTVAWVGSDGVPADGNANFLINGLAIYISVVGPASVTPLNDFNYFADVITLPTFSYTGPGNILAWLVPTITDVNAPQYTLNGLYWNGSAWVTSNLSFAQSNPASVIIANISTLPLSNTLSVKVYWQTVAQTQMRTSLFTANYTGQIYPTNNPSIAPNTPLSMDQLTSFMDSESESGSDNIGWFLKIGNSFYYFNGTTWVISNQTFAQSNPATTVNSNLASLPISTGAFVTPYAILYSATGATTPSLTSLTLNYEYFGPSPTGPNSCLVYGYIYDETGSPISGATINIRNQSTFFNQGVVQAQGLLTTTTELDGYFHITLYETTTVNMQLLFSVVYPFVNVPNTYIFGNAIIPNTPSANFATLTFTQP